ncbi:MAG: hypothetical protein WAO24_06000 [Peptococcia bacterium]
MKKMLKVIMPCILICLFLSACQKSYINAPATDRLEISTQSDVSSDSEEKALTKEQVIQIFMNEKDNSNCVITDCVVAEDMAYGLTGVVQYTDESGNPCYLAFVKDPWSYPVGLDAENICVIADDSILTYQGNGIVTLSLKNPEMDVIYDYTVEYSRNNTDTNFKVSSSERK